MNTPAASRHPYLTAMTFSIRRISSCALSCALLLGLTAQDASAQRAEPQTRPKPFTELSQSARTLRDSIVAVARSQVGRPYRFGGRSPERGFDCSGLVQFILAAFQREVPRTAAQQAAVGEAVERDTSRLRPGDLVTFGAGKRITHIGIYIGDGRFVHASSVAGRVIESPIDRRVERAKPWRGARRLFAESDEEPALQQPTFAAPAPISAQ